MATIYDANGDVLSDVLQGCKVCDEAIQAARRRAKDRKEDVVLEDDDGLWLVHPDGTANEHDW